MEYLCKSWSLAKVPMEYEDYISSKIYLRFGSGDVSVFDDENLATGNFTIKDGSCESGFIKIKSYKWVKRTHKWQTKTGNIIDKLVRILIHTPIRYEISHDMLIIHYDGQLYYFKETITN
jgi:hypothetical protein